MASAAGPPRRIALIDDTCGLIMIGLRTSVVAARRAKYGAP
jgi:hypothetical protein